MGKLIQITARVPCGDRVFIGALSWNVKAMRTTDVVAELLVGGVLTVIWLTLLAMAAIGPDPVIEALERGHLPFGVLILIVAYPLGVIFDRVWRRLLRSWSLKIKKSVFAHTESDEEPPPSAELFQSIYGNDHAMEYVNQVQNRMRVARSSVGNLVMITLAAVILITTRGSGLFSASAVPCLCGGVFLSFVRTDQRKAHV